jgi:rod shape-determining protein MreC
VIRLSIATRQALAKLTLPGLLMAAFGLMLLGKADTLLAERARIGMADALAPIYAALAEPIAAIRAMVARSEDLIELRADNARLRQENERLRQWRATALALDAENQRLRANLHWLPDPVPSFVTARVVADAGGVYARAVLLSVGPNHGVVKGAVVLDEAGLVGRVTEVGERAARVLLITDLNSRIPVILESSRSRAMLIGTNGARPRLIYGPDGHGPDGAAIAEGERVVTSAEANAFPADLPVGTIHYNANHLPEVVPAAQLDRLEIVRVFDYGLRGLASLDAPVRTAPGIPPVTPADPRRR